MLQNMKQEITIETTVHAPMEKVWKYWNEPAHIVKWCSGSDDWHTTASTNDLRVGGTFTSRMESKDGSQGFDFGGTYTEVEENKTIAYTIGDGRKVHNTFTEEAADTCHIVQTFEAEDENSVEMQRTGWQHILDNFKQYVENN